MKGVPRVECSENVSGDRFWDALCSRTEPDNLGKQRTEARGHARCRKPRRGRAFILIAPVHRKAAGVVKDPLCSLSYR